PDAPRRTGSGARRRGCGARARSVGHPRARGPGRRRRRRARPRGRTGVARGRRATPARPAGPRRRRRPARPRAGRRARAGGRVTAAQVVVGVDVGTTAAKVAAFGVGTPWRHVAVREYPLLEPRPGHQVQDPETVAAATLSALADAVAAARGAEVLALSVSTAMHGLIGLDEHLVPVTPLLTWADARSAPQAAALRASGDAVWLHQTTGTDRKSTRLNSSHVKISYAVFCLKKKRHS